MAIARVRQEGTQNEGVKKRFFTHQRENEGSEGRGRPWTLELISHKEHSVRLGEAGLRALLSCLGSLSRLLLLKVF